MTPTQPQPQATNKHRLYIEAGHGGDDPGAIAYDGSTEASYTVELRDLIKRRLDVMSIKHRKANGLIDPFRDAVPAIGSTMTDPDDVRLAATIRHINQRSTPGDLLLSIHFNFNHPTATGLEAFVARWTLPANRVRAAALLDVCHSATGLRIRHGLTGKVKDDTESAVGSLGILRNTIPQAILLEVCFLNKTDLDIYKEKKTILVDAICRFYFRELSGSAYSA